MIRFIKQETIEHITNNYIKTSKKILRSIRTNVETRKTLKFFVIHFGVVVQINIE